MANDWREHIAFMDEANRIHAKNKQEKQERATERKTKMPNEVWYVEGWKDGSDQRERSWHYSLAEAICREGDLKYEGFTTAVFHAKMVEGN